MEMTKKDLIQTLAKGVYDKIDSAAAYGHARRRLIDNQGVSEIALYSAVADHLEENDIDPKNYIEDMYTLYMETGHNVFFIKTDDRYSYLRNRFSTISMENSPESKGKFLCNRCFLVKTDGERCGKPNYKNSCDPCFKQLARTNSQRYSEKIKAQKEAEKNSPPPVEEAPELTTPSESITEDATAQLPQLGNVEPFIVMETILGDGADVTISISCTTARLSKLLQLIDPYLKEVESKKSTPEPTPEPTQQPITSLESEKEEE